MLEMLTHVFYLHANGPYASRETARRTAGFLIDRTTHRATGGVDYRDRFHIKLLNE
jgi:hypothetical protein